ncbi:MAG: hypothetical protein QW128_03775 [Thermoprotei archaeon]
MVKLERIYGKMMIMVKLLNNKLRERAIMIIREIAGSMMMHDLLMKYLMM